MDCNIEKKMRKTFSLYFFMFYLKKKKKMTTRHYNITFVTLSSQKSPHLGGRGRKNWPGVQYTPLWRGRSDSRREKNGKRLLASDLYTTRLHDVAYRSEETTLNVTKRKPISGIRHVQRDITCTCSRGMTLNWCVCTRTRFTE